MKFWLLESNQVDYKKPVEEIDFPEITEDMFDNENYEHILDTYLKKENLDSFSSHYEFDVDGSIGVELILEDIKDKQYIKAKNLLQECKEYIDDQEMLIKINNFLVDK